MFLCDVGDDVAQEFVLGHVDRDQLCAGALILLEFLDDLLELVFLFVRLLRFLLLAHYPEFGGVA